MGSNNNWLNCLILSKIWLNVVAVSGPSSNIDIVSIISPPNIDCTVVIRYQSSVGLRFGVNVGVNFGVRLGVRLGAEAGDHGDNGVDNHEKQNSRHQYEGVSIVKLRSRSRSGKGQVRVKRERFGHEL